MKCVTCGQEIPDGLNFCPLCGTDLTQAAAAVPDPGQATEACVDRDPSAFNPYSNSRNGGNGFTNVKGNAVTPEQQAAYGAAFSNALKDEKAAGQEIPAFDPYASGRRRNEGSFADRTQEGGARVNAPQGPTINVMVPPEEAALPPEYKPITMWGYVGYSFLFAIPIVGFILAIVYAFGGTQNVNLRNYARSYFVMFLIAIGISIILGIIIAVTGIAYRYW